AEFAPTRLGQTLEPLQRSPWWYRRGMLMALLPEFLASGFKVQSLPWVGPWLDTILPRFFTQGFGFNFYFGGTSLLIVVGVAMDTVQQVESKLVEHHYTGFLKKSRIRGRRG
ncbi:MAG TPA: hypothetical protein VLO07_02685, partial [Thermoanaerobaculia bacterium]|nr:hypothetical protein [Thermoanaerobaculia bacterium]